jgi:MFS family permease
VFLRKYSDASSTEVGTLLMVLPFLAVFTKPFFCALADRHRRYRLYFILALVFTLLGFGSYTFLPFFPDFIQAHGRACWYLLVAATVVGYIAYGVVWSLGDAYAANVAHRTGESFGMIRLWGTVGWGAAGALVGTVSPYLQLPEMVLGFIIFIVTHVFEIVLLAWWPHPEDFVMGDALPVEHGGGPAASAEPVQLESGRVHQPLATITEKPARELSESADSAAPAKPDAAGQPAALVKLDGGSLEIRRTSANSLAIVTTLRLEAGQAPCEQLAALATAATAKQAVSMDLKHMAALAAAASNHDSAQSLAERQRKEIADLQMTIFKMVAMKHKSLIKYLLVFMALGTVYNIHWSYFFLHLDRLASEGKGGDFSTLVGLCLVAQAVGETFCFAIAPWVVAKLGRDGAISLNAIAYAVRYFGNGLGIPMWSPYVAVLTESLQGINYGIFYYLITDTALHYALLVDDVIPELHARGLLSKRADLSAVRTSLRATMQGVFSGAFDGLGFGLGSLIAGLVLESHTYEQLWCYAGTAAFVIFVLHAVYELVNKTIRRRLRRKLSYEREIERLHCTLR